MDRRNFLRLAGLGSGVALVSPVASKAEAAPAGAGGLYYTQQSPGRWRGKEGGHLPLIQVAKSSKGSARIQVVTAHEMDDCRHYIVKHIVLDGNYRFLDEHLFDPGKDKEPFSEFSLGNYQGPIYVLSVCNKHDTWLSRAQIG